MKLSALSSSRGRHSSASIVLNSAHFAVALGKELLCQAIQVHATQLLIRVLQTLDRIDPASVKIVVVEDVHFANGRSFPGSWISNGLTRDGKGEIAEQLILR